MNNLQRVVTGLNILSQYDVSGDISMDYERCLYAGPTLDAEDYDSAVISPAHVEALIDLGWEFNDFISRWCWCA